MPIHLLDLDFIGNSEELKKRHPNGIYFNETILSEIRIFESGNIDLSYAVNLEKEGHPSLAKTLKTHLARVMISIPAAEQIFISSPNTPIETNYDIIFEENLLFSQPLQKSPHGMTIKITYQGYPQLRVLPARRPYPPSEHRIHPSYP